MVLITQDKILVDISRISDYTSPTCYESENKTLLPYPFDFTFA